MSAGLGRIVSFETFRQARERRTARVLPYLAPMPAGSAPSSRLPESPFRGADLTRRELEHRQRMLEHLTSGSA